MNKVLLTGRLTRDPELRVLASGKNVTTFSVAISSCPTPAPHQAHRATWGPFSAPLVVVRPIVRPLRFDWLGV
jgi:single-stranded DNA-binding protein